MRFRITASHSRFLARGAALALAGGIATGCSTDVTRFTGSIGRDAAKAPTVAQGQAYPGDVDSTYTGSVSRDAVRPAQLRAVPIPGGRLTPDVPVGGQAVAANPYPARVASTPVATPRSSTDRTRTVERQPLAVPGRLDTTVTGSTARSSGPITAATRSENASSPPATPADANGWTRTGGTEITLREGETIYNLSRRFGVPAKVIMEVNGISNPRDVAAGQKITIPIYIYSQHAAISAPDNNPDTAIARSSRGTRFDVSGDSAPVPQHAPKRDVAVLPEVPAVRERESTSRTQDTARRDRADTARRGADYVVVSGDSLYTIAKRTGVTVAALKQANSLSDGMIRVGQSLIIPAGEASTASAAANGVPPGVDPIITGGAGPSSKAKEAARTLPTYTPPSKKADAVIEEAQEVAAAAPDATGIGRMRWPVRGRVISTFGSNSGGRPSDGIDIAVPVGTSVKAAENGIVIYAGDGLKEFGNTVLVRHEDGLVSVYGHNSSLLVKRGQTVRRGQEIARAGNSGSADMPKLHFELRKNSVPVDPQKYLE